MHSRGHNYSTVSSAEEKNEEHLRSVAVRDLELSIVGGLSNVNIHEDLILDELKVWLECFLLRYRE